MATIPTIQLFRNSIIKTGRQAAIDALEAQKASVPDGGLILARYSKDGTENDVKTLLGIVRNSGSANAELTVIDVEGAAENVQTAIEKAINGLNQVDSAVDGQYVSSVSEENGIIKVTRTPLPSVEKSVVVGEAVTAVTQTMGQVSVEYGSINANNVSVIDSMNRFDSDNVEDVLYELFDFANSGLGSLGAQIGNLSTSSTVTLESVDETEGFLKVYTIRQGDREVGTINIPKDLVVTSGSVVKGTWDGNTFTEEESGSGTALKLVIANQPNPVYINTLDLVKDHTAGNGIAISDTNVISVKKAEDSEGFLTVSESGVKLSGVQAAIDAAAASAKTKVEKKSDADKITLESAPAADGSVTYTIGQNDIASAALLGTKNDASTAETAFGYIAKEVAARTAAIGDLNLTQVGGEGKVITTISQSSGKVSVTAATLGAENVSASTITDDGTKVAVTGDNVAAQISSLATSIKSVESAATTALTAETTARQTQDNKIEAAVGLDAEGNHITPTGNYTKGATTVVGEIAALDTKLKEVSDTLGTGVTIAEGKTVTAQLQALSGTSESNSGDTSVKGAKKYTDGKIEELSLTQVGGADKVITTISQTAGKVSATAIDLTANNVKATESTGVSTAVDVTGKTVSEQIASLATSIKSASTAAAAAHTQVTEKNDGHVKVTVSSENSHDVVTITEDDIASAAALATETTNRQNADTELSNRLGDAVTTDLTATAQLRALSGSPIDGKDVTSVYGAKAYAKDLVDNLNAEVGSTTGTSKTEAIKIVQTKGKIASITLGAFDCGTY